MEIRLLAGDCIEVMQTLPECSVDAVVTDPPYGLEFMNKQWDGAQGFASSLARAGLSKPGIGRRETPWPSFYGGLNPKCLRCGESQRGGAPCRCDEPEFVNERLNRALLFQQFCQAWAAQCLRVLKPGGHLLAFGGSRTYHRMACAIEDAGFEIRDQIMWIYGSGFPKSQDVAKAIDKAAGARRRTLGVAYRAKPMNGGAYGSDRSQRRARDVMLSAPATAGARRWDGWGTALKPAHEPIVVARKPLAGTVAGNVLAHGTGALNIAACRVDGVVTTNPLVRNSPGFGSQGLADQGATGRGRNSSGRWPANVFHDGSEEVLAAFPDALGALADPSASAKSARTRHVYGATGRAGSAAPRRDGGGSAARFFYCAKASCKDRGPGNHHPTVKPTPLMRYLCRLVTPPAGLVLDPFAGSGSTGKAAVLEGFGFVGIEREPAYLKIARERIRPTS